MHLKKKKKEKKPQTHTHTINSLSLLACKVALFLLGMIQCYWKSPFTQIININSHRLGQWNTEEETTRTGDKTMPSIVLKQENTWKVAFRINRVTQAPHTPKKGKVG